MSQSDEQGRPGSGPHGPGPTGENEHGQQHDRAQHGGQPGDEPQYGQPPYGQQYGQPGPYGQQYGQPGPYGQQYGQPAPYGQPPYGQSPYGRSPYDPAPQSGPQGAYGQYGDSGVPAKPGSVVTAAVLGFVFGAVGVLLSLSLIVLGAAATGASGAGEEDLLGLGEISGTEAGAIIGVGLAFLVWTVLMIWGSVWALTGRSRVLLLVGGSIALAFTSLTFVVSLADLATAGAGAGAGGIFWTSIFVLAALAVVVLLSLRSAADFFRAHRARREAR